MRTTVDPSTVSATVDSGGGLMRFRGTDADQFEISLDEVAWTQHVDVPSGVSTVYLRVTPVTAGSTLSAEIGIPA